MKVLKPRNDNEIDPHLARCKKLRFRCWHRGTKEMDTILGRFADENIFNMSEKELDQFEALLERSDPDIYNWYTGREAVPKEFKNPIVDRLVEFEAFQA